VVTSEGPRYSEREFALILRRAAELAAEPSATGRSGAGFTLAEIKAIAAEVGMDPALVERAARLAPTSPGPSGLERVIGGPVHYRRDFRVPGELTDVRTARLLAAIRAAAGQHGEGDAAAAALSWSSRGEPSRTFAVAHSEDGETHIRLGVDRQGGLLLTTFLNLTGGIVAASVVGAILDPASFAAGAAIVGTGVAAGLAGARTAWTITSRRTRERLDALVASIGGALEPAASASEYTKEPQ
jgi:hypothetical protein